MRKRLEDVEETRRRIVEAAVDLHGSVGPANTTFSAVAELADVQRSTVYRHFPDEEALFGACTSHWLARNPWPRAADWREHADPLRRLGVGLRDLYRYYESNRSMIANSFRDIEVMPSFVGEMMRAQLTEMHEVLTEGWEHADPRLGAVVAQALDFRAWSALDDAGLDPVEAADVMAEMISCLASPASAAASAGEASPTE